MSGADQNSTQIRTGGSKDEWMHKVNRGRNGSREGGVAPLPSETQSALGSQLRRLYGEALREQLPDRLARLLEQLSNAERTR